MIMGVVGHKTCQVIFTMFKQGVSRVFGNFPSMSISRLKWGGNEVTLFSPNCKVEKNKVSEIWTLTMRNYCGPNNFFRILLLT